MITFKQFIIESHYVTGQKYSGIIHEIKYLPVSAIHRQELDFRPEVMSVSDEVARNMDFSEPVEVAAFRYAAKRGLEDDDQFPEVTLTDGHHRTAAALQTGKKWLPVRVKAINAKGEKLSALIEMSQKIESEIRQMHEEFHMSYPNMISESINDSGIMKAVFVIGLPGAGKSYTIQKIKGKISPMIVNTDKSAEFLSKKWDKKITSQTWPDFRDTTYRMTKTSLSNYINGMLPLFIDGTSNDVSNILHRIGLIESIGYDVGVVFVHASLKTALKRAADRAESLGRSVDVDFIKHVYAQNEENAQYLKSKVSFFKEVENNSDGLNDTEINKAFKAVQSFFSAPVENPVGKRNMLQLIQSKEKYLVPTVLTKEKLNHKIDGWYKT